MPECIPDGDDVSRLFSPLFEWNAAERRPAREVFRASDRRLSAWHGATLLGSGHDIRSVCLGRHEGAWEARLCLADCEAAAELLAEDAPYPIEICFAPDEATGEVEAFAEAHVDIATHRGDKSFPKTLQRELMQRSRVFDEGGRAVPRRTDDR